MKRSKQAPRFPSGPVIAHESTVPPTIGPEEKLLIRRLVRIDEHLAAGMARLNGLIVAQRGALDVWDMRQVQSCLTKAKFLIRKALAE